MSTISAHPVRLLRVRRQEPPAQPRSPPGRGRPGGAPPPPPGPVPGASPCRTSPIGCTSVRHDLDRLADFVDAVADALRAADASWLARYAGPVANLRGLQLLWRAADRVGQPGRPGRPRRAGGPYRRRRRAGRRPGEPVPCLPAAGHGLPGRPGAGAARCAAGRARLPAHTGDRGRRRDLLPHVGRARLVGRATPARARRAPRGPTTPRTRAATSRSSGSGGPRLAPGAARRHPGRRGPRPGRHPAAAPPAPAAARSSPSTRSTAPTPWPGPWTPPPTGPRTRRAARRPRHRPGGLHRLRRRPRHRRPGGRRGGRPPPLVAVTVGASRIKGCRSCPRSRPCGASSSRLLVDRRITDAGSHPSAKFNAAPRGGRVRRSRACAGGASTC